MDLKVTLHFEQNIDGYNIVYDRAIIACMHTKQNKNIAYSLMIHFFRVKMKITGRKFVLKRNNITIMYPKSNIT